MPLLFDMPVEKLYTYRGDEPTSSSLTNIGTKRWRKW